jgi:zinc/manganese transport system substrate-binding protein
LFKRILAILSLLVLLVVILGCQSANQSRNNKRTIVVTYSILGSVVKDLVGDKANVIISVPNGLDPHDWEPSAKDIEAINKADLVVQNGLGLESGLEKTLGTAKGNGVKFLTASDYITVRHVGAGEGIPSGDPDQVVGAADPHLWMDPLAMENIINGLSNELAKDFNLDVAAEAVRLANQLEFLNSQVVDILSSINPDNRKLVTGHESMGYFAQRYKLKLVGVIVPSLSSQAGVAAADISALVKNVEDNKVKAIFTELGTSPAVARIISDETGVKVVELTTHALPSDGSYSSFLKNIANIIANNLK